MQKTKYILWLILILNVSVLFVGGSLSAPSNYTTVQNDDSSNMQIRINSAISNSPVGSTVYLPAGTYKISDSIILKTGVSLEGAGSNVTTIRAVTDSVGGVRSSQESGGFIEGMGITNVDISNIRFESIASGTGDGGRGESRNCILLHDCSNVKIHGLYFARYLYNDGVKCTGGNHISVYDCVSQSVGHDFVEYLSGTSYSSVRNCLINVQTNTGVRLDNANNCIIEHNTIYDNTGSGWCAIEIEDTMKNNKIEHNILRDMHGSTGNAAIQYVHANGELNVTNNVEWGCTAFVAGGSPDISNNILNPDVKNESYWVEKGYGYNSEQYAQDDVTYYVSDNDSDSDNSNNNNTSTTDNDVTRGCNDNSSCDNDKSCNDNSTKNTTSGACGNSNICSSTVPFADLIKLVSIGVNQSYEDSRLSSDMLNSSINDVVTASTIANGGSADREYVSRLIMESTVKEHMAKDLFNMSTNNLEYAREQLNKSINNKGV